MEEEESSFSVSGENEEEIDLSGEQEQLSF